MAVLKFDRNKIHFYCSRIVGLFVIALMVLVDFTMGKLLERSDFVGNFYIAGHMIAAGKATDLYPGPLATNYFDSAINLAAHHLLPDLPATVTAIYMYSPLVAVVFAPFSLLPPAVAMCAWQTASVLALWGCAWYISALTKRPVGDLFFTSFLFLPLFHILVIGQLAIVFGLLPLAAGIYFFAGNRPFLAGVLFALSSLKPQYVPIVLLIVGAYALTRQFKPALGLLCGLLGMGAATFALVPLEAITDWFASFKLSDTIFTNPAYGYQKYLVSSLPGAVLQTVPLQVRDTAKLILYSLSGVIGLFTLFMARRIVAGPSTPLVKLFSTVLLGVFVLPLILPHFLFYDLGIFILAGMIVYSSVFPQSVDKRLRLITSVGWIVIDLYYLLFALMNGMFAQPFALIGFLILLFVSLICALNQLKSSSELNCQG